MKLLILLKVGVVNLPVTNQDKLFILRDLLHNQHGDNCGTSNECQQIQRLAEQFLQSNTNDAYSNEVLTAILQYANVGSTHQSLDTHITNHKDDLNTWVEHLDTLS